jgi:hypothetical protein
MPSRDIALSELDEALPITCCCRQYPADGDRSGNTSNNNSKLNDNEELSIIISSFFHVSFAACCKYAHQKLSSIISIHHHDVLFKDLVT